MAALPHDQGGWILPGRRPRDEIALGLVGKLWRPVIEFANVTAEMFGDFAEPGWAETAGGIRVLDVAREMAEARVRTLAS